MHNHESSKQPVSGQLPDVFKDLGGVVQVELADSRSVLRWLKFYSDTPEDRTLFLERAAWVNEDGGLEEIRGPGILLTKQSDIRQVMFLSASTGEPPSMNSPQAAKPES